MKLAIIGSRGLWVEDVVRLLFVCVCAADVLSWRKEPSQAFLCRGYDEGERSL